MTHLVDVVRNASISTVSQPAFLPCHQQGNICSSAKHGPKEMNVGRESYEKRCLDWAENIIVPLRAAHTRSYGNEDVDGVDLEIVTSLHETHHHFCNNSKDVSHHIAFDGDNITPQKDQVEQSQHENGISDDDANMNGGGDGNNENNQRGHSGRNVNNGSRKQHHNHSYNNTNFTNESESHGQDDHDDDNEDESTNTYKQNQEQGEEEANQILFSCQCDSARTIATLLSCLRRVVTANAPASMGGSSSTGIGGGRYSGNLAAMTDCSTNKVQHATVYAGPSGLTFHVQHGLAKQSQCSVDMPKGLFREYFVGEEEVWLEESDDEEERSNDKRGERRSENRRSKEIIQGGEFGINLTTVLECFSVLSRNNKSMQSMSTAKGATGGAVGASKQNSGDYASLERVPLCMSYDRGTALLHLEFLEGGNLPGGGVDASTMGGGVLVTCEVPGVAVSDDVDDSPDEAFSGNTSVPNQNSNTGLASAFRSTPLLARAILYSDALQAAVAELYDVPGASVVEVSFSNEGMELGTRGPRSEVWVNVPYHRNQGGMYVGLECYNSQSLGKYSSHATISNSTPRVGRYSLGAFLTGMRGLDIGCETCISVNTRGMMAIQHQVSREGYYEGTGGGDANVRPSFVDFIMTCIEDEDDEEEQNAAQHIEDEEQSHDWIGSQRNDSTEVESRQNRREISRRELLHQQYKSSPDQHLFHNNHSIDDEGGRYSTHQSENQHDNSDDDDSEEGENRTPTSKHTEPSATSRILGELEVDQDLMSSDKKLHDRRKDALDDIRRRRREERLGRQSLGESNGRVSDEVAKEDKCEESNKESDESSTESPSSAIQNIRKRRSSSVDRITSHKSRRGEDKSCDHSGGDDETNNSNDTRFDHNPSKQSQSEEDDDDDSEPEDSLDVTAEIPQLFKSRSSMSTSRRRSHGNSSHARGVSGDVSDGDASEEPKMMYGDTRLEFTQDGYQSGSGNSI